MARKPIHTKNRYVVVTRRPRAAANFDGPYTLETARRVVASPKWPDAVAGIYALVHVEDAA